jgi:hypothetical protein
MEEVSLLLYINQYVRENKFDVILLDCAPTGESLRFISLPTTLEWYMDKIFKLQRRFARYARPVVKHMTDMPLPEDGYFQSIENLFERLRGVDPIPIFPVNLFNGEASGYEHLKRLGDQIYGPQNPLERFYSEEPFNLNKINGHYHLKLKLPFVTKNDIELNKLFDELIVRIGSFKRHIMLPKQVAAFDAVNARVDGQHLNIIFEGGSHDQ